MSLSFFFFLQFLVTIIISFLRRLLSFFLRHPPSPEIYTTRDGDGEEEDGYKDVGEHIKPFFCSLEARPFETATSTRVDSPGVAFRFEKLIYVYHTSHKMSILFVK